MRKEVIGDCELYLGDCREILPTLGRGYVLVTDPPYGVDMGKSSDKRRENHLARDTYLSYEDTAANFVSTVRPAIDLALACAKRGAVFSTKNIARLSLPDAIGGVYLPTAMGRHCWGFNSLSLIALYGTAPGLNNGSKATVLRSSEPTHEAGNGHPCPKPLGWMKWLVELASAADETVVDPFMGSGTTGVACVRLGRKFIGIEIEPAYFEIACARISEAYRQPDMFVAPPSKAEQLNLLAELAG
jgi:site-specific DNA-methyltransferase (adenine-specific)